MKFGHEAICYECSKKGLEVTLTKNGKCVECAANKAHSQFLDCVIESLELSDLYKEFEYETNK